MIKNKKRTVVKDTPVAKLVFKSRFGGLVKVDANKDLPSFTVGVIEGEQYYEFAHLPGIYFSAKLFV